MIPALPVAALDQALDAGDFDRARALLAGYEHAVRDAIAAQPPDAGSRSAWLDLLREQRLLAERLQRARDQAGAAMRRLRQGQRRAAAYHVAAP